MLGDDARQRHGQVVAKREIGLARCFVLAAPSILKISLVALVAVLAGQRLDVLERRRLERLEAIAPIHVVDDANHVVTPADVVGKKVAHAARGARLLWHKVSNARLKQGYEMTGTLTDIRTL